MAAVAVFAAPAAAATPCWKRLVNDWYDGRIDRAYSVACYRAAIENLPEDVQAYSDARDDINRALLQAIRDRRSQTVSPGDVIQPEPPSGGERGDTNGETATVDEQEPAATTPDDGGDGGEAAPGNGDDDRGPLGWIEPANADSIPLPLLILAGLALLLLALAAGGYVTKRLQERRLRPTPRPPQR